MSSNSGPVATNVLILVSFPAAEEPANHGGHFTTNDMYSQIGFRNPGNEPITIEAAVLMNFSGEVFYLTSDDCTGRTLAPDDHCIIWLELDPPAPPGRSVPYSGQLIIRMPSQNAYQVLDLTADSLAQLPSPSGSTSGAVPSDGAPKPLHLRLCPVSLSNQARSTLSPGSRKINPKLCETLGCVVFRLKSGTQNSAPLTQSKLGSNDRYLH